MLVGLYLSTGYMTGSKLLAELLSDDQGFLGKARSQLASADDCTKRADQHISCFEGLL